MLDGGGSARQFSCLSISADEERQHVDRRQRGVLWSPQVTSKSTSMLKNRIEMLPVPLARHGVGPSSEKRRWMLSRSTPDDLQAQRSA